jgi:hypothetical protein
MEAAPTRSGAARPFVVVLLTIILTIPASLSDTDTFESQNLSLLSNGSSLSEFGLWDSPTPKVRAIINADQCGRDRTIVEEGLADVQDMVSLWQSSRKGCPMCESLYMGQLRVTYRRLEKLGNLLDAFLQGDDSDWDGKDISMLYFFESCFGSTVHLRDQVAANNWGRYAVRRVKGEEEIPDPLQREAR